MKFWDSSGVVPLLVREAESITMRRLLRADPGQIVWAFTPVEVASALWRRRRSGDLDEAQRASTESRLARLAAGWSVVLDPEPVIRRSLRLLARHPLRAADALQLGAALVACGERPELLPFVTLDERLAEAAGAEGFQTLPVRLLRR